MAVNDCNTALPDLDQVTAAAHALGDMGFDVHTVTITLNGQHGGWDVDMRSTDTDMQEYCQEFVLHRYGSLERV